MGFGNKGRSIPGVMGEGWITRPDGPLYYVYSFRELVGEVMTWYRRTGVGFRGLGNSR